MFSWNERIDRESLTVSAGKGHLIKLRKECKLVTLIRIALSMDTVQSMDTVVVWLLLLYCEILGDKATLPSEGK